MYVDCALQPNLAPEINVFNHDPQILHNTVVGEVRKRDMGYMLLDIKSQEGIRLPTDPTIRWMVYGSQLILLSAGWYTAPN